jgi:hypothetical protein
VRHLRHDWQDVAGPGASTRDPGPKFFHDSSQNRVEVRRIVECCGKRPFGDPPQLRADRRFACVVAGYWVSGFSSSNLCGDAIFHWESCEGGLRLRKLRARALYVDRSWACRVVEDLLHDVLMKTC